MTDEECKAIEAESLKNVREAIKTITSGDIYDRKGYLNGKGYKALEVLEFTQFPFGPNLSKSVRRL